MTTRRTTGPATETPAATKLPAFCTKIIMRESASNREAATALVWLMRTVQSIKKQAHGSVVRVHDETCHFRLLFRNSNAILIHSTPLLSILRHLISNLMLVLRLYPSISPVSTYYHYYSPDSSRPSKLHPRWIP